MADDPSAAVPHVGRTYRAFEAVKTCSPLAALADRTALSYSLPPHSHFALTDPRKRTIARGSDQPTELCAGEGIDPHSVTRMDFDTIASGHSAIPRSSARRAESLSLPARVGRHYRETPRTTTPALPAPSPMFADREPPLRFRLRTASELIAQTRAGGTHREPLLHVPAKSSGSRVGICPSYSSRVSPSSTTPKSSLTFTAARTRRQGRIVAEVSSPHEAWVRLRQPPPGRTAA